MFVLTGELPPSGVPELGFESVAVFDELASGLTDFEAGLRDVVGRVGETFPEEVAGPFAAGVALLTGASGGVSVFDGYRRGLREMGEGRLQQSLQLQKA
ncbi:hypothetical protein ACIP5U_38110, partial [Streptomyces sp. NPDC088788]|uniref:hypothetical protein n=1 Tax=Streptomyces sp. NPDC088788 TaxID=3365898 RepID=UPI0038143AD4